MQTTLNNTTQSSGGSSDAILAATNGAQLSDMFTKLLVAQIQNQDPLSPSDPSQFVSQLTQLSQVEALNKMSSQTGSGNSMLQSLQTLALGGQVGSSVMVQTGTVELGSSAVHGTVTLGNNTSRLTLTLTGEDGQPHVLSMGPQVAGPVAFSLDPAALGLPAGSYSIAAQTENGASPAVEVGGTINSVRVGSNGSAVLNISGVGNIDAAAITQFNGRPAA